MLYLIAYDISSPKRLARVARLMERYALRVQKSVFLFRGNAPSLEELLNHANERLLHDEDVVQAWKLAASETPQGKVRGTPLPRRPAAAICEPGRELYV